MPLHGPKLAPTSWQAANAALAALPATPTTFAKTAPQDLLIQSLTARPPMAFGGCKALAWQRLACQTAPTGQRPEQTHNPGRLIASTARLRRRQQFAMRTARLDSLGRWSRRVVLLAGWFQGNA
jgi:hypothetical protein